MPVVKLQEVRVGSLEPARLEPIIGSERAARFAELAEGAREMFAGRSVVNVNSTATGGGVAEMLQTLLAYARGAGVDAEWLVIRGDPEFFAITKRIHNGLYGAPGDGGPLGPEETRRFEAVAHENAQELVDLVDDGDIVVLHDPQPAGTARELAEAGARVVWRCHVGVDRPNQWSERAWEFLRPYVDGVVDAYVFSRAEFAPEWVPRDRLFVIPPSIDPFAPKNQHLDPEVVHQILVYTGIISDGGVTDRPVFTRGDGSPGRVDRTADVLQSGPPPPADAPLIVQVSRWDRMKDMAGVLQSFAEYLDGRTEAHLILVGPGVSGVADDPEGGEVLDEVEQQWRNLPHSSRRRTHLVCLPMTDVDENAIITNAIQRHAAIVTQKSLAEGFGLTVSEAMFKGRPVVASAVGGIVDQVVHGETGLLVDDPTDLAGFARHLWYLLEHPDEARRFGEAARARAVDQFLGDRHLGQWAAMFARVLEGS